MIERYTIKFGPAVSQKELEKALHKIGDGATPPPIHMYSERHRLAPAIDAFQGPTKRRGRPPEHPLALTAPAAVPKPAKRKKRTFSAHAQSARAWG